jgi:hypothetical protein
MAHDFILSSNTLANGRMAYYAKLAGSDEAKFTVGFKTLYQGNYGLFNIASDPGLTYNPATYAGQKGFWAYFIHPTARAESKGSFFCLNTYDRARFTFGFMQYAAHVPNGDFVKFFRALLKLPNAKSYFPRLSLVSGHIFYTNDAGISTQLEDDTSTGRLMDYLNPSLSEIENQEVICAARMVHWAMSDPAHRALQVDTAIDHFKNNMTEYDRRYNLNGAPAKVCQLVCDIRHQGRGNSDMIAMALNTGGNWDKAYSNLAGIGYNSYKSRIDTVKNTISALLAQGVFDKTYRAADNSFV